MVNRTYEDENKVAGIPLVTHEAREYLNPRQEIAYQEFRRDLITWMLNLGKDPAKAEGYAHEVVKNRANKIDLFYRWVWDQEGRFVQDATTDHADAWMEALAHRELAGSTKSGARQVNRVNDDVPVR